MGGNYKSTLNQSRAAPMFRRGRSATARAAFSVGLNEPLAQLPQLPASVVVRGLASDLVDRETAKAAIVHEPVQVLLRVVDGITSARAARAGGALPAVIRPRGSVALIGHAGCETTASLLLADIGLGHRLVESREEALEERVVLAEEARFSNAARVKRGEDNAGLLVIAPVQLLHEHHVAHLAVLVSLGAIEVLPIKHGDGCLHPLLQALHVANVRQGRDHATELRAVHRGRDGAQDHATGWLHGAALQVLKQELAKQEVAQVVGCEAHLIALRGIARPAPREEPWQENTLLVSVGVVHRRVADQGVQGPVEGLEGLRKVADALGGCQVAVQHLIGILEQTSILGRPLRLLEVSAGHDHVPFPGGRQLPGCSEAQPRRGPGDDHRLLVRGVHEGQVRELHREVPRCRTACLLRLLAGEACEASEAGEPGP
mmetsp:Transcript_27302/g.51104  ORF Transcript_27302/g.51104 Transcript_27302/m.51104 type:complete len:430 (-) Transcript_27302:181-1470(-)